MLDARPLYHDEPSLVQIGRLDETHVLRTKATDLLSASIDSKLVRRYSLVTTRPACNKGQGRHQTSL